MDNNNKFIQVFDKNNLNEKDLKNFEVNSYASFCMNYVNSLKKVLNFKEIEEDNKKIYEIDIPYAKNVYKHYKEDRTKIKQVGEV